MLENYRDIENYMEAVYLLETARESMYWDQVMDMPARAEEWRGNQMAQLTGIIQERMTSPQLIECVEKNLESAEVTPAQKRNLRELKKWILKEVSIPKLLAMEVAKATAVGESVWEKTRKKGDFKSFLKAFKPVVALKKEQIALQYPNSEPMDGFIDSFSPGILSKDIDPLFEDLKKGLTELLDSLDLGKNKQVESFLDPIYAVGRQKLLCEKLIKELGFSPENRTIRESAHPFSINLGKNDFRITTRYAADKMFDSFLSLAHEMGHSLYDEGLMEIGKPGMPISKSLNYAAHESQSLFWENRVICSMPYLQRWAQQFKLSFPEALNKCEENLFPLLVRQVKRSLIRVEADEVTYCLHIIIRYEIERAIFQDNIPLEELPDIWNELYQRYLGVEPLSPKEGCMQDVHWSGGSFGYFPSYALGHLMTAQMTEKLESDLSVKLEESYIPPEQIRNWLTDNVYSLGAYVKVPEYVETIRGEKLSSKPFLNYLKTKYEKLYT